MKRWRVQSVCEGTCEDEPGWSRKHRRRVVRAEDPRSPRGGQKDARFPMGNRVWLMNR